MNVSDTQRESGRIKSLKFGYDHDHRVWTFCADIRGSVSGDQGFALTFDAESQLKEFVRDVCTCFGVADAEILTGAPCYALRCWGTHSEDMEGLESEATGNRITRTGWARENKRGPIFSPGERRVQSLQGEIAHFERRLAEEKAKLAAVFDNYIDWSTK